MNKETIKPGIWIRGVLYFPTGTEWLIFFASFGCEWAIEALKRKEADIYMTEEQTKNMGGYSFPPEKEVKDES